MARWSRAESGDQNAIAGDRSHIEDHERIDAPTRQSARKDPPFGSAPHEWDALPHDLPTNAAHLVRRVGDTAPERRKGSIPKNDRAHKKPVKAEFRSIPERFAQHCWDEGGEEHRRFMLAESSTTVPARPAQRQPAPGAFEGAILALFVNG
jgi:hypothetical protein